MWVLISTSMERSSSLLIVTTSHDIFSVARESLSHLRNQCP